MSIPDEVYISNTETLPRELVSSYGKRGCCRCSGAGWFWYSARGQRAPYVCACASGRVAERIAEAQKQQAELAARPVSNILSEAAAGLARNGGEAHAVILSTALATRLRGEEAVRVIDGAVEGAPVGTFRADVAGVSLIVYPDPCAPPDYAGIFGRRDWAGMSKQILARDAEAAASAERETVAAQEIGEARAALVAMGDA